MTPGTRPGSQPSPTLKGNPDGPSCSRRAAKSKADTVFDSGPAKTIHRPSSVYPGTQQPASAKSDRAARLLAHTLDSLESALDCLETAQDLTDTDLEPLAESLAASISKAWELLSLEQVAHHLDFST